MLQDASKRPPDALKTTKITFQTPPRPPNTSTRGFQMPPRRSSSPPRQQKPPQEASTCLQDAQYRFQDPPKCSSAAPTLYYFLARFMPSPCQFPKYARDVCPQRPSTMADCQIRGRLPRVFWRWFARVGRLRSARTPWCFSGVFRTGYKTQEQDLLVLVRLLRSLRLCPRGDHRVRYSGGSHPPPSTKKSKKPLVL